MTAVEKKPRGQPTHVPALDGLRGVAILLVLGSHLVDGRALHSAPARALLSIFHSGWAGVDLFFVLSGFLITGILLRERKGAGYFRNFYARRVLRIFPLYYAVLFVVFVLLPHVRFFPQEGLRQLAPEQVFFWTYTSNLRSAWANIELNAPGVFLNHFWSLAIEEQFYIVWPAVVFLCRPTTLTRICMVVVLGSLLARLAGAHVGLDPWQLTAATPFHVDALAMGALLAQATRHPPKSGLSRLYPIARVIAAVAFVLLVSLICMFGDLRSNSAELSFALSILAAFFAAILAMIVSEPGSWIARRMSWSVLRIFGRYSYGLYVFSSLLQPYLEDMFSTKVIACYVPSFVVAGALHLILDVTATLVVAVASYHLFEKRFLALKRHFEYRKA